MTNKQLGDAHGWESIKHAPRDGEHFLAIDLNDKAGFGAAPGKLWQPRITVVHWWGNPGEEGFYTSVNELEPQHPFTATHWKPLPEPPEPRACGCVPPEFCKECY